MNEKHDLGFDIGVTATIERRVEQFFGVGLHVGLAIRNWQVIGDVYNRIDPGTSEVAYAYVFGWLSGTGWLELGPHLTFRPRGTIAPWLSVGTSVFLAIDTREESDKAILGHAAYLGVGYDLPGVGFGVRASYAPADAILFKTTGPSVVAVIAGLEFRSR